MNRFASFLSRLALLIALALSALLSFKVLAQTRTPWQMNLDGGPVCFGVRTAGHGDTNEYTFAPPIPSTTDPGWVPAPNGDIIAFSTNSSLGQLTNCPSCPTTNCTGCSVSYGGVAGDFTFFQTFVFIPTNLVVTNFAIFFSGVDDGARVTIFNSVYPTGQVVAGSYVLYGQTNTANLAPLVTLGESNRVVVTLVDDKCTQGALSSAIVVLNTTPVQTTNLPPVALCTPVTINTTNCAAVAASINHGSYDPEGDPLTLTQSPAGPYPLGTNAVMLTVLDNAGKSSTCSAFVIVRDATPPTLTCPADVIVPANASSCAATNVSLGTPVASDICSGVTITSNAPASFAIGTNTVLWTARDASGNTSICQQKVIVRDTQAPAISCPSDITVNADASECFASFVYLGTPAVGDNCGSVTITSNAPAQFTVGTNLVTWTARDASSNSASCLQRVIVRDVQAPSIFCSDDLVFTTDPGQCTRSSVYFSIFYSDNCPNVTLQQTSGLPSGSLFPRGVTTNRFTLTDASANSGTCSFTVTIVDAEPPTLACPANLTVNAAPGQCASNVTFTVTATDNCSGPTVSNSPPSGFPFPVGTTLVTSTATDPAGNAAQCTFTVTVLDAAPPVLTCPANITTDAAPGQCASNVTFTVTATDNCSGPTVSNSPPSGFPFPVGTTLVTSPATHPPGNAAQCTFTVTVLDAAPPVLTCPANITTDAA